MNRTPHALLPWIFLLLAVAGGLFLTARDMTGAGHAIVTGTAEVGGPFRLVDQNGTVRTDRDFRGRWLLVYFGYTNWPDVCPTTLAVIADAMKRIGPRRARLVPLFISLDPARDTPRALKTYLAAFGPEFVGLTGSPAAIRQAANDYRVYYATHPLPHGGYAVDHTGVIYLMGPDGSYVALYEDASLGPDSLAADLRRRIQS